MEAGRAVEVRQLRREYRRRRKPVRTALAGLDLVIEQGEVHGLLGPNGAGKTTLCKILCTILLPTSGTALVNGFDVVRQTDAVRRSIGVVFGGERGLYTRLSARQNLRYWSALYRQPSGPGYRRVEELLTRLGLADRADEPVETFSRGMKQRLHLARGLIADPATLIFDEPTIGMDPVAARDFRVLVGELRDEGKSILLTTHDMAEAEVLCDRVSLIDHGNLLATESPLTIGRWLTRYERVRAERVPDDAVAALRLLPGVGTIESANDTIIVETLAEGAAGDVLRSLLAAGVTTVSTERPSLEEVYLRVIGERGLAVG
jgi:ABC-2 type transport system ATP-binding protein